MATKRQKRRMRRRRTQRGGGNFAFEFLDYNFLPVSEEDLPKSDGGMIKLFETSNNNTYNTHDDQLCNLVYEIHNKSCYLSSIECSKKTSKFKPISFIIVKKLLDILKIKGTEYIYLIANPTGETPHKLCKLYESMGFFYPPDDFKFGNLKNNPNNIYNKKTNESIYCGTMIGKVDVMLNNITNKIKNK
jgi:hypothetical protein